VNCALLSGEIEQPSSCAALAAGRRRQKIKTTGQERKARGESGRRDMLSALLFQTGLFVSRDGGSALSGHWRVRPDINYRTQRILIPQVAKILK
jgi:hypothetical protein